MRTSNTIAAAWLSILLLATLVMEQTSPLTFASDQPPLPSNHGQSLQDLFESEFAILRIQGNQVRVEGVGFVVQQAPIRILTCYHVVSEGNEQNEGPILYAIARRTEATNEIDVRKVTWS
jgi:hypothetical protein